jgi:hypothetical protein
VESAKKEVKGIVEKGSEREKRVLNGTSEGDRNRDRDREHSKDICYQ